MCYNSQAGSRAIEAGKRAEALEKSSGPREDATVEAINWGVLDLVTWGAMLVRVRDCPLPSLDDRLATALYMVKTSEDLKILDNCAWKTTRLRGEQLTRDCIQFLSKKMAAKPAAGRPSVRADRGLLAVVEDMEEALRVVFEAGDPIVVNIRARQAEMELRRSLRAQCRGAELHPFTRDG